MKSLIVAFALVLLACSSSVAQESSSTDVKTEKLSGFAWLEQFEGTWVTGNQGVMKSQSVGKLWMINELSGQIAGGYKAVQSLGYDSTENQFTGTWIDSTSTHRWHYKGSLDASGKVLTLEAEGPDFSNPKKMRRYQDIYEFKSADEIAVSSTMMNDDGEFKTFQTATMTRKVQSEPENSTTVTPFLMFIGKAEAAINFYKTVFEDTKIINMTKYKAGENGKEGTVKLATIEIAGQNVMCIDSLDVHDFDFTPSFSFFVECENEDQLKERFAKLSDGGKVMMPVNNYGFSKKFGWASDKFGVSWQLNLK